MLLNCLAVLVLVLFVLGSIWALYDSVNTTKKRHAFFREVKIILGPILLASTVIWALIRLAEAAAKAEADAHPITAQWELTDSVPTEEWGQSVSADGIVVRRVHREENYTYPVLGYPVYENGMRVYAADGLVMKVYQGPKEQVNPYFYDQWFNSGPCHPIGGC